ncbi:MAG: ATP-grasp domain-containing protein [Deltaproteobacteria bacterium]|nr:ATP-grasp domain-containing protein [Deltaproteobacteria bacterium]
MATVADSVLLVLPKTSYQAEAFLSACAKLGVEVIVATDHCRALEKAWDWPENEILVDLNDPGAAVAKILERTRHARVRAVVPAGGEPAALVAARTADALGLPCNPASASTAARNKHAMRELLARAGVPSPRFALFDVEAETTDVATRLSADIGWPCVIKPLLLSASRGVMRVDDPAHLAACQARLRELLLQPELLDMDEVAGRKFLAESFVPGQEVALEGILKDGSLRVLALFDKPDPLDGPFFEETIYVTPSRHPSSVQSAVSATTEAAARAMGLSEGPVHAELRLAPGGPVVIEVAARSIGGLCSRILRFGTGLSLEEVIVRHALGEPTADLERESRSAGVMMLPIPARGRLAGVEGVSAARAIPGIWDLVISVDIGREVVPLPEGSSYLGFLFAAGDAPDQVESTLRAAYRELEFKIVPSLPSL